MLIALQEPSLFRCRAHEANEKYMIVLYSVKPSCAVLSVCQSNPVELTDSPGASNRKLNPWSLFRQCKLILVLYAVALLHNTGGLLNID